MRENRCLAQLRPASRQRGRRHRDGRSPLTIRPGGRIMRIKASTVVDLPDPDSPTRPSRSPARSEKRHAADRARRTFGVAKSTRRDPRLSGQRAGHASTLSRALTRRSMPTDVISSPTKMSKHQHRAASTTTTCRAGSRRKTAPSRSSCRASARSADRARALRARWWRALRSTPP